VIVLFTDYGVIGPYMGQLERVLRTQAPGIDVITLFADAPCQEPQAAAYLLGAYWNEFPAGTVFLAVVDPGVGTDRAGAAVRVDGRWFVGPENGLFSIVVRRAEDEARWWRLTWQPDRLSATFHGRDWFAPVAARLARGVPPPGVEEPLASIERPEWPDDFAEIIYIDGFGNAMSGVRASSVPEGAVVSVAGRTVDRARTFAHVPAGQPLWYENANGLVEIAVNRGRADRLPGVAIGTKIRIEAAS
jgi:hypothetical protein